MAAPTWQGCYRLGLVPRTPTRAFAGLFPIFTERGVTLAPRSGGIPLRCVPRITARRDSSSVKDDLVQIMNKILERGGKGRKKAILPKEAVSMFCDAYSEMDRDGKEKMLLSLARDFTPSHERVLAALNRYRSATTVGLDNTDLGPGSGLRMTGDSRGGGGVEGGGCGGVYQGRHSRAYERLREELTPAHEELFRSVVAESNDGVRFVVGLREDLLRLRGGARGSDPHLCALDDGLRALLQGWFSAGFLELQRITYERSDGAMLEKIARYEAVHPVRSLSELKERLGQGRRCFAFLHPCVPGEPLVFVHVALLPEMARGMGQIREKKAEGREGVNGDGGEDEARWAIFYSITATQKGLKGVQLGNFLIKRVVKQLREELPQVESFATLSPIPSFRTWLTNKAKQRAALGKGSKFSEDPLLSPTEAEAILRHTGRDKREYGDSLEASAILTLLAEGGPLTWGGEHQGGVGGGGGDGGVAEVVLTRLAARYLTMETVRGKILDPVGHFHVSNGAKIERVNWMADPSQKGMRQSCGIMVNYRYDIADIEANFRAYMARGEVATSERLRALTESS